MLSKSKKKKPKTWNEVFMKGCALYMNLRLTETKCARNLSEDQKIFALDLYLSLFRNISLKVRVAHLNPL